MWVPKNRCFIMEDPVKILSTWTIYHQNCEAQAVRDSLSLFLSLSLSEKNIDKPQNPASRTTTGWFQPH